jgi:L-alanine-DL-glutamate epimerase-like enolase superfamily enzyme
LVARETDITVRAVEFEFEDVPLRAPLKFGTGVITDLTYARATVRVENGRGKVASGRGSILLSDLWAYPTEEMSHAERDAAMRSVCGRVAQLYLNATGHPIDVVMERKPAFGRIGKEVSTGNRLPSPVPLLAVMVCASPVDAALHDAFGRVNGISSYVGYGKEFWEGDLSPYLGSDFRGVRPDAFVAAEPKRELPVFHLVGGADKLTEAEVDGSEPDDGRPASLEEWIRQEGVYCFKVKLTGLDVAADVDRTGAVATVAQKTLEQRKRPEFYLSVDSNEMCPSPESVVEYLEKLRERYPRAYDSLLYLEQPTQRDLRRDRSDMREVAERKPVLADEGITSVADLRLARQLGWSGVALKTCKGHTSALLCVAAARRWGMLYSVQDLTNPGLALAHSVGLAARLNPIKGVEANARQFLSDPLMELGERQELVRPREGLIQLSTDGGTGLRY